MPKTKAAGTQDQATASAIAKWLKGDARPLSGRLVRRVAPGLDLVVPVTGPASWMLRYQLRGLAPTGKRWALRAIKIGSTASHSLPEVMDEMVRLKARVLAGEDPAEDRRAAAQRRREAALVAQTRLSCREALTAYASLLAARRLSPRHSRDEVGHAFRALTSVGVVDEPPASITAAMVEAAMARCPTGSRRARFTALHRFLIWALRNEGSSAVSPTFQLSRHEKPKPVPPRERVLSQQELAAIWHAAAAHPIPVTGDVTQFLITVPARENEVGRMRWHDVDMAAGVWEMPTSKNGAPHRFPLSPHALAILQRRRWAAGGTPQPDRPVFPAPRSNGRKPYVSWNGAKLWLDRQSGVGGWVIHDFRRSFATHMAEAGFDDGVIDLSLNHRASGSRSRVTRTYNLSVRWAERVRLMHAWSRFLDTAIGGTRNPDQTADILELPGIANAASVSV
jgi:integrase